MFTYNVMHVGNLTYYHTSHVAVLATIVEQVMSELHAVTLT